MEKINTKEGLHWLGFSTLLGLVFGLIFGYLNKDYGKSLIIACSIGYTIWLLNCLLRTFFLYKVKNTPRGKRLLIEVPSFFATSVLGFLICMSIFSKVYRFDVFVRHILWPHLGLIFVIYLVLSGLIYASKFYKELKEKEATEEKLKALAAEVELKALKSQMNPHFLFNALNSINALVTQDSKLARQMIARLSELLRMSLESRDETLVSLKKELDFAHHYLEIEKIRFSDRLEFREEIDPQLLGAPFPAMILQPLLENAVKHGIAKKRAKGDIRLELKRRDDHIECFVSNSVAEGSSRRGMNSTTDGTGLENIRHRLDLLYPERYTFRANYTKSGTFEVNLSLPLESHG